MSKASRNSAASARRKATKAAVGKMLSVLKTGGDVRKRKVRRLRGAVRAERYENDLKLAIATDRLLTEL